MKKPPKPVLRAEDVAASGFPFGHPLEEEAEVTVHTLSRLTGLTRTGLNLVRVAPGRKAFPLHRHHVEEEWVYVLQGEAEVTLDDETVTVGPGSFVAFHPGGPAHQVQNAGTGELVCLMGGETRQMETIDYPEHGKRLTRAGDLVEIGEIDSFETFDFFARTPPPGGSQG